MTSSGWVKNHRKIREWGWYKKPLTAHLFQHLVREANHKPGEWMGQKIDRGQLVTGRESLAKDTGLTEQEVRTALKHLKSTNDITITSTNKFSIITIVNYNEYQSDKIPINQQINQQVNQQSTSNQPAINHKQECKECKKEKEGEDDPQVDVMSWILNSAAY